MTTNERPVPLTRATRLPNIPEGTHVATLFRWSGKGIKGIRLETVMAGGRRCTSAAAVARFFEALSNPAVGAGTNRPTEERRKAIAVAEKRLADAGI